jgi:hypothetical protein
MPKTLQMFVLEKESLPGTRPSEHWGMFVPAFSHVNGIL